MIIGFVLIWIGIGIIADLLAAAWMFMVDHKMTLNLYSETGDNPTEALARVTFIGSYKDMPWWVHLTLIVLPVLALTVPSTFPLEPKE